MCCSNACLSRWWVCTDCICQFCRSFSNEGRKARSEDISVSCVHSLTGIAAFPLPKKDPNGRQSPTFVGVTVIVIIYSSASGSYTHICVYNSHISNRLITTTCKQIRYTHKCPLHRWIKSCVVRWQFSRRRFWSWLVRTEKNSCQQKHQHVETSDLLVRKKSKLEPELGTCGHKSK